MKDDTIMTKELLLEIGTEEIPAGFVPPGLAQLKKETERMLAENRITHGKVQTMGTPRRLVLIVKEVSEKQADTTEEKQGPLVEQAFDKDGRPTRAALGFARSVGVEVEDLVRVSTAKGDKLAHRRNVSGEKTEEILSVMLPEIILSIRFPKSMHWGNGDIRFVRPIHWILALFGEKTIPFSIGETQSGNSSRGHRFTHPEPFPVKDFADYMDRLDRADVVVDPVFRKDLIEKHLLKQAEKAGGELIPDPDLLDEVTYLVEYPVVVTGRFDEKFLRLSPEVLIQAMRSHQRYFSIKKKGTDLELLPCFITVCNTPAPDLSVLCRGNERVLLARLNDAEFFYQEDLKHKLDDYASELKQVVYHNRLGSYAEKALRLQKLMGWLCEFSFPGDQEAKVRAYRSALLCKADLISQMVGEFPGLQGIIGAEYSQLQGEHEEVVKAIREHYLPRSAEDIQNQVFPASTMGTLLSLADKMDAIVGGWVVGLAPTGSQDPYALRRQALGVIHLMRRGKYAPNLVEFIDRALALLKDRIEIPPADIKEQVLEFFKGRLRALFLEEGFLYDAVDSVLAVWNGDPVDAEHRVRAISGLKSRPDFEPLMIAFKRVVNIIEGNPPPADPTRFEHPSERKLYEDFQALEKRVQPLLKKQNYEQALAEMAGLRPTVDRFFDDVLVNVENNEPLRQNRHALLNQIGNLFKRISDFSKIVIPGSEQKAIAKG